VSKLLRFGCDYMEGAHPAIIKCLVDTNMEKTDGYGFDPYSEQAREKIRKACACDADVYFTVGGTQTNKVVIDALLKSYQGVIAADTGHISVHEAGAIEHDGHKVLTLPQKDGKISASQISSLLDSYNNDLNHEHMVMPGMVYISQPTEYGTLYSFDELSAISRVCRASNIPLYIDGARLAYALASYKNDVTLPQIASLCDAFYIGGTKCGALLGEAIVIPKRNRTPSFFTIIKQHGALLAKGRLLGIQFNELLSNGLYERVGKVAIDAAERITSTLKECGYQMYNEPQTNQIFFIVDNKLMSELEKYVSFGFWERLDGNHTVIRIATSWATKNEDVDELISLLKKLAPNH